MAEFWQVNITTYADDTQYAWVSRGSSDGYKGVLRGTTNMDGSYDQTDWWVFSSESKQECEDYADKFNREH